MGGETESDPETESESTDDEVGAELEELRDDE